MMYGWFLRCGAQHTEFYVILDHFCPLSFTILHRCTINDNHMMHGSWDKKCDRQNVLSFWTIFCPFTSLTTKKIKILKKWKKHREILSLYTHMYHKWQPYDVCFLRYGLWQTEFFVTLDCFLPFYPPKNPKNQNFEMKKTSGDIIILYMCTKNDNDMMYGSWDMECDRQNFLSFWTVFAFCHFGMLFAPLITPKIKTLKNWKKFLEISSFYTSVPKIMIICFTAPYIWGVKDVIVFILDYFLPFYSLKNQN